MKRAALMLLFLAMPASIRAQTRTEDADTFFELKIRPVLIDTCFKCHGGKKVSNGLRVDSRVALLKGGDGGPAVVPGDPGKSLLLQAIEHTHEEIKMPPGKRLPDAVVHDFSAWVKNGAAWPETTSKAKTFTDQKHWAFEPIRGTEAPADPTADNPIDRFIEAKLRENGLRQNGPADKRTLLRRVYFDLIGLPPTPAEMTAFLADDSPEAFAKVVERLLASPRYGERWGRHWMDVVRYADTAGDNADYPIPEARLYRDYIIDSFNADKPFDEFVREQIAGDILAEQGPREKHAERVVATGYLALSRRYGTGPFELWHLTMEDTLDTIGRSLLGLTLRCARCHDHKFDPVTKEDYYALYGIFASAQFPWAGSEEVESKKRGRSHFVPLAPKVESAPLLESYRHQAEQLAAEMRCTEEYDSLVERIKVLKERAEVVLQQLVEKEKHGEDAAGLKSELAKARAERDQAKADLANKLKGMHNFLKPGLPAGLAGAYAVQEGTPADARIHVRGDAQQLGHAVKRNVPRFLGGDRPLEIPEGSSGRLQFAHWLTRPEHPLTARVLVNRVWQHHFGKGIVGTPSNFGLRGEEPTHPELLDWLTARFIDSGWSIKALHRRIVLSRTYQCASGQEPGNAARDAANRCYWRCERRRLDAEAIRDAILHVSGTLDDTRPGPHPFPPFDQWHWTQHNPFKAAYPTNHRSVYLMTQRIQRHPYLALFDGADTNVSTEERGSSIVPQQALFLMNNPFVAEQAERFAGRLIAHSQDPRQRVELAHRWAWSRPAQANEIERDCRYVQEYTQQLRRDGAPSDRLEREAWTSYTRIMLSANEFVYID